MTRNPCKPVSLLLAVLLLLPAARAAAANFTTGNGPALIHGVHELTFTGNGGVADPFATAATVTFSPPSGTGNAKTVEMFWDGGNTWRARAYVTETGNWTWSSSCPADPGLDAKSGAFTAGPSALRGKLKPHPGNARALVTANGQWFAPIGDTAYYMLGSSAYQNYVRDDWNHGVNFLRCAAFGDLRSYAARFTEQSLAGIPKLSSLQSDDTKLKWMLENHPGIYLQYIMFRESASGDWNKYSTTAKNELMQQMVARYGAFPTITWMIMNDSAYPTDDTGDTAVANIVSSFLLAHDTYQNLRCTGARRGAGAPFAGSAWTTFLHFETSDAVAADEADSYASYNKFTWCGEDRYETYIPPTYDRYFFRRLMWAWLLSGGSACYGGDWDATTPYDSTGFVGLDSVQYIKGYFESRNLDLGLFAYNDSLATDALATGKDRPQACNRGTAEYLVYHPNGTGTGADINVNAGRTASFNLNLTAASGTFDVEWFRCLDGVTAAGSTVAGGAVRTLTAPWAGLDVVCRLTGGTSIPDTEAPSVPQGASATPQSSSSIRVTWSAATDNVGVSGYEVERDGILVGSPTATSFTDTGLSASSTHSYIIKAFDAAGNRSEASAPAGATTLAPDVTAPTVPANLTATALSSNTISLTWAAAADDVGVAGYEVYRDGTYADTVTATGFTDTGLAASTPYGYWVKAFDAAGNRSEASGAATATTFAAAPPAVVLAEETFDSYTAGSDISGKSGGTGWTSNWVVTKAGMDTLVAGNVGGVGTGNSLAQSYNSTTPQAGRTFAAIDNTEDRTVWLGFWLQAAKVKNSQTLTLSGSGITGNMITIAGSNSWTAPTYQFFGTTVVTPATTAAQLFMVKITITAAGTTTLTCHVNPDLGSDPASWPAAATSVQNLTAITGMVFRSNNNSASLTDTVNLDDIRLATTWQGAAGLPPGTPIETWRQEYFATPTNTGDAADDADPNHNGIVNLLEYALGGDPLGHTTGLAILPQAERGDGNLLRIRFTRYPDRSDLTLTAQAADSPAGAWSDLAVSTAGAAFAPTGSATAEETGTGNTRSVTVTDIYPMDDPAHPSRFMRLKAER